MVNVMGVAVNAALGQACCVLQGFTSSQHPLLVPALVSVSGGNCAPRGVQLENLHFS